MIANFIRLKHNTTIEDRTKRLNAVPDVFVPKLNIASPLWSPCFVKVDQDVQSPVELSIPDVIEVDMHIQVTAWSGLMYSSAYQLVVWQKALHIHDVI